MKTTKLLIHFRGRKFAAFVLVSALVLIAGWTLAVAKLATIVAGLVALYTAFATGHSLTDIAATKSKAKTEEGS